MAKKSTTPAKKRARAEQPTISETHSFREYDARIVFTANSVYHSSLPVNDDRYIDLFPDSILKGMTAIGGTRWGSVPLTADSHTRERQTCAVIVRGFLLLAAEARSKGHHIDAERFSFQAGMFYDRLPSKEQFLSKAEFELHKARKANKTKGRIRRSVAIAELQRRRSANPNASKTSHLDAMAKEMVGTKYKWGSRRTLIDDFREIR